MITAGIAPPTPLGPLVTDLPEFPSLVGIEVVEDKVEEAMEVTEALPEEVAEVGIVDVEEVVVMGGFEEGLVIEEV